jgi:hypothetical protein
MRIWAFASVALVLLLTLPVLGAQRMVLVEDFTNVG